MDSKQYWNNRYQGGGNSGYGSYGEQLAKKLSWLKDLDIQSISEIGCGDLNFAKSLLNLYPDSKYTGHDISETILEKNRKENPGLNFVSDLAALPDGDLLMCIDVLFHVLDDQDYNKLLVDIRSKWTKYLAITAYERDGEPHETGNHVEIRKFYYKSFGEPVIREIVEEDGNLFFYLWKK